MWMDLLVEQAAEAVDRGELSPDTEAAQLAWELHAFGLGLNWTPSSTTPRSRGPGGEAIESRLALAATAKGRRRLAKADVTA